MKKKIKDKIYMMIVAQTILEKVNNYNKRNKINNTNKRNKAKAKITSKTTWTSPRIKYLMAVNTSKNLKLTDFY